MNRFVARPPEVFDAVVVGSGFGGSVTTHRLAEGGLSVCLLERGRAYPPGSFPRRPSEVARAVWDPSEGLTGLFDVWSFRKMDAIVSAGLGGGSLIYANVLLRKDERWFHRRTRDGDLQPWPVTAKELEPDYVRVEEMLAPRIWPVRFENTPKTALLQRAARDMDLHHQRVPLAVTFGQRPTIGSTFDTGAGNLHRVPRQTCSSCGCCDLGCNFGSKNTLDLTYLSRANPSYADIRTGCEVRSFEPVDDGWEVRYVVHEFKPATAQPVKVPTAHLPVHRIRCRRLVLSAGALGTNYLLLRNRAALPGISDRLGEGFSGNGDHLGFLTRTTTAINPSAGPVITGAIRVPDHAEGSDSPGMYIEDGGYPNLLDWINETIPPFSLGHRATRVAVARVMAGITGSGPARVSREVSALVGDAQQSANRLPLLTMGMDCPDGRFLLRRGYLDLETGLGSAAYYRAVNARLRDLAEVLRVTYRPGLSAALSRLITVHPLGGAAMADDPRRGVVNEYGEVFGCPGLVVADGSVMPGPVGANPSMTIAALAERFSRRILEVAA
jgi:cholesterol oxidase